MKKASASAVQRKVALRMPIRISGTPPRAGTETAHAGDCSRKQQPGDPSVGGLSRAEIAKAGARQHHARLEGGVCDGVEGDEMIRFGLRRLALMAGSVAVLCTAVAATAQGDGPRRAVLAGSKPAWTAAASSAVAVPAAAHGIDAKVWLAPRDASALDALARAVSDPSSPRYGQFLSADQARAQFAPTSDQVTQVSTWLAGAGLTVRSVG